MSKANDLHERIDELEAENAALRRALEEIREEAETDFDRDIILTACNSALAADAGRPLLERLRIIQAQRDDQNEQIRQLERER